MRTLTQQEITTLTSQGCSSRHWEDILVTDDFQTGEIWHTHFSGKIALHSDVRIFNSTLEATSRSSFGQGTQVNVLDETGGRSVLIHSGLSSQSAYLQCLWRYQEQAISSLQTLIKEHLASVSPDIMTIETKSSITNCRMLRDVCVGEGASLVATDYLEDGTVMRDSTIGPSVIARHFIVSSSSEVTDAAQLNNVFVGNNVKIGGGFTADHSLFFTGCEMFHGEACAYFGGPFSVSHHKNTLLIACMTSFFNAGSGTNFSNHLYKSGPIHYGILRRGCKMASDAHLIFPSHVAPFTTIFGEPEPFQDTSRFPFSYLSPRGIKTGINIFRLSPYRDQRKWKKRYTPTTESLGDLLHFDAFSPYTVEPVRTNDCQNEFYSSLLYIYASRYARTSVSPSLEQWDDIGGMMTPHSVMLDLMNRLAAGDVKTLAQFQDELRRIHDNYDTFNAQYATALACHLLGTNDLTSHDLTTLRAKARHFCSLRDETVIADALKEFTPPISSITFGSDADSETSKSEFSLLRGNFDEQSILDLLRDSNS